MGKVIVFIAVEALLLVTPMMFPEIPLEAGTFIWGVALTLFVFAFYLWWNVPNKLSLRKKKKISALLKGHSPANDSLDVFYFAASTDCANLANDIADALSMAGIPSKAVTNIYGDDVKEKDIWIRVSGESYNPPLATLLVESLRDVGLKVKLRVSGRGNDRIHIYVGPED